RRREVLQCPTHRRRAGLQGADRRRLHELAAADHRRHAGGCGRGAGLVLRPHRPGPGRARDQSGTHGQPSGRHPPQPHHAVDMGPGRAVGRRRRGAARAGDVTVPGRLRHDDRPHRRVHRRGRGWDDVGAGRVRGGSARGPGAGVRPDQHQLQDLARGEQRRHPGDAARRPARASHRAVGQGGIVAIDLEPAVAGDLFPREHPGAAPTALGWLARAAFVAVVGAVSLWYIFHFEPAHSDVLATGVIVGIGALSLNVLVGYAAQSLLGQQVLLGLGAFTSAYVISQSHQSFYAGLAAGAVVGIAQAVVLGLVALRVRGLYFALVTLVWGFVGENSIFRLESFTGGGAGQDAPRPGGFTTDRAYLGLCVIVLAVILLIDWRLVATKAGRAMQALRESPQVAANYGVNVRAYTLLAFAVAGFYAGVAGALFGSRRLNVVAAAFPFAQLALPYLIVAIVGGLRRRGGIVVFALRFV